MEHILVIEDDRTLSVGLCFDLEAEGYRVSAAFSALEAFTLLAKETFDLVLLDGNLPDIDGFELCPRIKEAYQIPVIFLTARDLDEDQIAGFDCGADDYITKPFNMALLYRRISALLKRCVRAAAGDLYQDGCLTIDFEKLQVIREGRASLLTPTEYKLLRLLVANSGQVLTRQLLLEKLYDEDENYVDDHVLEVNINRLRRKLETPDHKYIKTVYGMGYLWIGEGHHEK